MFLNFILNFLFNNYFNNLISVRRVCEHNNEQLKLLDKYGEKSQFYIFNENYWNIHRWRDGPRDSEQVKSLNFRFWDYIDVGDGC